jgi:hypothetical protein
MVKKANIGLRNAWPICNMPPDRRLEFIAEGLPVLFESAKSLLVASQALGQGFPREAAILERLCEEEGAKVLILVDIIRCPKTRVAQRVGPMIRCFYDHLARLIYAEAQGWWAADATELQKYIDDHRGSHYLEDEPGYIDFIMPNWALFERESSLYADVVVQEHGDPMWHSPVEMYEGDQRPDDHLPTSFRVVAALEALGVFTSGGLKVLAEVWGKHEIGGESDVSGSLHRLSPNDDLFEGLRAAGLITERATSQHARDLRRWQLPMYNMEFRGIEVGLDDLREQRDANLNALFL